MPPYRIGMWQGRYEASYVCALRSSSWHRTISQVANPLNRFGVSSWMPFKYNSDSSLDLDFQNESPGADKEGELAACAEGPVQLDDAPRCAEGRSTHRQMEPAGDDEGANGSRSSSITQPIAQRLWCRWACPLLALSGHAH